MIARIKRIITTPKEEWPRIDAEPMSTGGILTGWVLPLAAIGPVAGAIGQLVFGITIPLVGTIRPGIVSAVSTAVIGYVLSIVSLFLISLIINALAPSFGGTKNKIQALKVAAFAMTASYVGGIFQIVPMLAMIGLLLSLYSFYLLYLGLPRLMGAPQEKAAGYTIVTIVCTLVLSLVGGMIALSVGGLVGAGPAALADRGSVSGTATVPGLGSVDLGKLEEAAKKAEQGPPPAIAADKLAALLPASVAGWTRSGTESSSAAAGGIGGSQAEARFTSGTDTVTLSVVDMAAMSGLTSMAAAMNVQREETTETGYERVNTVDGRMITESWDNEGKNGRYSVIVGGRFTVEANGNAPDPATLKAMVESVDLARLEALAK
ncbi:YIP1 family protein [Sphingomonas deserti]|uniref:YIP1 family protein n=2 Tax=Allosphingosinicella deserti TaxID=2116704 RepID=A0A2P7QWD8_9SPHN|nr:YIP1 family protein [Sphingomonas deserti]